MLSQLRKSIWPWILLPAGLCLAVYWRGLLAWFAGDDFLWLFQSRRYDDGTPLSEILFRPTVHGTWRPFSERLFLFGFERLFGSNAFPARLWVMATQFANFALLVALARRVFGDPRPGASIAAFWISNGVLATVMCWTSSYMQLLTAFCFLAALLLWARHLDTGRRRFYAAQWAVFLFGFGVMETIVVYPALATALALSLGYRPWKRLAALWAGSVAFYAAHTLFVPKQAGAGVYAMKLDPAAMAHTALFYARHLLAPRPFVDLTAAWGGLLAALVVGYLAWAAWRRRPEPWLGAVWLAATLAPYLLLSNQTQVYYLTLPALGFAWLLAGALYEIWTRGERWRAAAPLLAAVTCLVWVPGALRETREWFQKTDDGRTLYTALQTLRRDHPQDALVVVNARPELFWYEYGDNPLRWLKLDRVYFNPAERAQIVPADAPEQMGDYFPDPAQLNTWLREGRLRLVSGAAGQTGDDQTAALRDAVVKQWSGVGACAGDFPTRVVTFDVTCERFLGVGWREREPRQRWMARRAEVTLGAVDTVRSVTVRVEGYAPDAVLAEGPVRLTILVQGRERRVFTVSRVGPWGFDFDGVRLAPGPVFVEMEVDRVYRQEGQEFGLVVTVLERR